MNEVNDFTIQQRYMGKSCVLHFEKSPMKISHASKQYIYDQSGIKYLDCVNNASHVGHCHPHVVRSGQRQLAQLSCCYGFLNDAQTNYLSSLMEHLKSSSDTLSTCFLVNSGSEAIDLALRLARAFTGSKETIVLENSFHGGVTSAFNVSPKYFRKEPLGKKKYVHVAPIPDSYRGLFRDFNEDRASDFYANEVARLIDAVRSAKKKIGAFLCEPIVSSAGVIELPRRYLKSVYGMIRDQGGICIVDEVVSGLGRTGETFWGFEQHDVTPDIIVLGKQVANGFPMGVVITRREIANSISQFYNELGGNPVACMLATSVLDVIRDEHLQTSAKQVGQYLHDGFKKLKLTHPMLGDVRGKGLIYGLEIVVGSESRKPAAQAAAAISYKLRLEERILLAANGPDRNVLIVQPPLCFTRENAAQLLSALDHILGEVETGVLSVESRVEKEEEISMLDLIGKDSMVLLGLQYRNTEGSRDGQGENSTAIETPQQLSNKRHHNGGGTSTAESCATSEPSSPPAKISRYEDVD